MKQVFQGLVFMGVLTVGFLPREQLADKPVDNKKTKQVWPTETGGSTGFVELRIYSDRPNPTWPLSEQETEIAFSILAKLPRSAKSMFEGGPGYRGFRVKKEGTLSRLPHEFEVYNGIATDGAHSYKDTGRRLERWVLRSGKAHTSRELYEAIEEEIKLTRK